ncbi:MAG: GAF domain-containing SpoIIE family protein phosphatase [Bacteroidota bacterium]
MGIHVLEQSLNVYDTNQSWVVGSTNYQLVMAAFMIVHTVWIGRIFSNIEKLNVATLMWRLFMIGMVGITLVMLITFANRALVGSALHRYLIHLFFLMGLYAMMIFFLSATFIFRRFILYPRTKRKILFWRVFLGFLGFAILQQMNVFVGLFPSQMFIPVRLLGIPLFLVLCIFLSTNVRWTAYLNFNQKLRVLGLFALVALVTGTYLIAAFRLPGQLGLQIDSFEYFFLLFLVLFTISYTIFSILVLFFNLPTTSIFERESVEIASFNKINQAIQSNLDFSEIIKTLLDASVMAASAQAGWVEMVDEEKGEIEIVATLRTSHDEIKQLKQGNNLTRNIMEDQRHMLIKNIRRHKLFRDAEHRFKCLLGVPIVSHNKGYGAVYVVNELTNSFEDVTVNALTTFAEQAGMALENARLIKNNIELERYQEQLKIAKEVQSQLLPSQLPVHPGIQFAARSETAQEVGGDYFDVIQVDDHTFRLAIGDVSGKGTTAAFYMAEIKGIFHALTRLDIGVKEFIVTANQALSSCMQHGFFMTLTYLQINLQQQSVELIRAGHSPVFHFQHDCGEVHMLREGTLGLGIVRNGSFERYVKDILTFPYQSGDFLVLYTDGILEARNEKGEEYGYERLEKAIRTYCEGSVEEMSEGIVESVKAFAHSDLDDDYTVLIVKFP